jgi:hypothetical protein
MEIHGSYPIQRQVKYARIALKMDSRFFYKNENSLDQHGLGDPDSENKPFYKPIIFSGV